MAKPIHQIVKSILTSSTHHDDIVTYALHRQLDKTDIVVLESAAPVLTEMKDYIYRELIDFSLQQTRIAKLDGLDYYSCRTHGVAWCNAFPCASLMSLSRTDLNLQPLCSSSS